MKLYIFLSFILFSGIVSSLNAIGATYRYDDYSEGRKFFSDGQEWKFSRISSNGQPTGYTLEAKIEGDTAISYYMDYYGEIVRVDQPCKIIKVSSDAPDAKPASYAAYEWDAEIYVYSDSTSSFVQILNFQKKENVKFLYNGEKWQVDRADYVYPKGRLLKRYNCSALNSDVSSSWIYRVGADNILLNADRWGSDGSLRLENYYDPEEEVYYSAEDFDAPSFQPDNAYYPEGKEWVYVSGYYQNKGDYTKLAHSKVSGSGEMDHVDCKKLNYWLEGSETNTETALVCSHDGVMYERGYMGLLSPRYDFRLRKGDRAVKDVAASEVTGVEDIEINGQSLRCIHFKGTNRGTSNWNCWIEGIGSDDAADMLPYSEMESLSEIYFPGKFVNCLQGDNVIFTPSDFSAAATGDSGIDGVVQISDTPQKGYTLDGLESKEIAPGRIVIRNGRKYLFTR